MSGTESELGHSSSSGIEVDPGMEPGAAGCTFPACLPATLVVAHPHSLQVGFPSRFVLPHRDVEQWKVTELETGHEVTNRG